MFVDSRFREKRERKKTVQLNSQSGTSGKSFVKSVTSSAKRHEYSLKHATMESTTWLSVFGGSLSEDFLTTT